MRESLKSPSWFKPREISPKGFEPFKLWSKTPDWDDLGLDDLGLDNLGLDNLVRRMALTLPGLGFRHV
jgi:hypothetical protein